ncbi:cupin domain-containing protein [Leptolyngbyaceae cyanobacterium UHCC 1019]
MKALKEILAPYPVDQFLSQDWTQQAVYIPDERGQKFQSLFTWKDLNNLLNFHRLEDPNLRFSLDGKSLPGCDRTIWHDRIQEGATLIINEIDEVVPAVSAMTTALRIETGHQAQVNLYCSPAQQQGFDNHYDTHDVLILQIDGEKDWFVFRDTVPAPLTFTPDQLPPEAPPYLECTLKPGDVLYIPRGHWHYAIAGDRPSLHLTLGIHCQTGIDWLLWVVGELQNQPTWRQNLPFVNHGQTQGQTQALEQALANLSQHLHDCLQEPDLRQRYQAHLTHQVQPIAPFSLPAQLGIEIFHQGLETRFVRPPFLQMQLTQLGEQHHQIAIGTKQITLKGLPDLLLPKLLEPEGFSILEMADWAPDLDLEADVVPLLTRLVTEGVLLVDEAAV